MRKPLPSPGAGRSLIRSGPRPMALEQRFMFDGAAVVDAASAVSKPHAADTGAAQASGAAAAAAREPAVLQTARQEAERQVTEFLSKPDALQHLFTLFNGGQAQPSQAWQSSAQTLLNQPGFGAGIEVQLRSQAEMHGALGAFSASGPDGKPVIFLNADWVNRSADTATLARVLVEELGHGLDARLNGAADTAGDEGEAFAVAISGQRIGAPEQQRIATENDHGSVTIDGVTYAVEDATVSFTQAYTGTPSALSEEASALNNIAVLTPFGGTGFQFVSANPGDPYFSGNNVTGYLQYKDSSGVDQSIYGVASRQFKSNGVTNGFYFYAPGADGVIGTGDAGEVAYLLVTDPTKFTAGGNYGTSSDPVDTALNNYLNHYTPASALDDAGTAVEKGGLANGSGGSNATGNVLGNDAGSANPAVNAAGTSTAGTAVTTTLAGGGTAITGAYGVLTIGTDGNYSYAINNANAAVQALRGTSNTLTDTFTYRIGDTQSTVSTARLKITIEGANDTPVGAADVGNAKVSLLTDGTAYSGTDTIGSKSTGNVLSNDTDVDKYGEALSMAGLTASGTLASYTAGGTATSLTFSGSNGSFYKSVNVGDYLYTSKISNAYYLLRTSSNALIQVTSKATNADGSFSIGLSGTIDHYSTNTPFTITGGTTKIDFYPDATRDGNSNLPSGKEATVNTAAAVQYSTITLSGIAGNVVVGMTATGTNIPAGAKVTAISGNTVTLDKLITSAPSGTIGFLAAGGTTVNGALGTLVLNSDGSYVYTPLPDATGGTSGSDVFTYTLQDVGGLVSTATLTINVQASTANDPNARDDAVFGTEQGTSAGVNPAGNAVTGTVTSGSGTPTSDAAGSGATFGANPVTAGRIASASSSTAITAGGFIDLVGLYGTLRLNANGTYVYTIDNANPTVNGLNTGAALTEVFYYTVTNSLAKTDTATLTITINGANDAPIAASDAFNTSEDTPLTLTAADLLGNDSDPDSTTLTLASVSSGAGGTVVKNPDGTVTFTPTANFNGNATFTYTVSDGVTTTTGTVVIAVAPVNDYPIARGNDYTTPADTLLAGRNVITNNDPVAGADGDVETPASALTVARVNGAAFAANGSDAGHLAANGWMQVALSHGILFIKADGTTEYRPAPGDTTGDSFTYTISDGSAESDAATVQISVSAVATPTISVSSTTVSETSPYAVFEVSLDFAAASSISFNPTLVGGTATIGTDTGPSGALQFFNGSNWVSASGGVTLAAGTTSVLVRTAITNDVTFEGAESFSLATGAITGSVANASGATGVATIKDDGTSTNVFLAGTNGPVPVAGVADNDTPTISVSNVAVSEASPYAVFRIALDRPSTSSVAFTPGLASGSASVGTDTATSAALEYFDGSAWVSASSGITLAPGVTSVLVRTAISNDAVYEGAESFTLGTGGVNGAVTNAAGATGTGTIQDDGTEVGVFLPGNNTSTPTTGTADDDTPAVSITVTPSSVVEDSGGVLTYTIALSHASAFATTVNYALSGTATAGSDYTSSGTGTLTIAAGATTGTITITPSVDGNVEPDETVVVTLTAGSTNGRTLALGTAATGSILNDDVAAAPTITITSDKSALRGGETATLTFTLSEPSSDFTLADISVSGGTLSNFAGSGSSYSATFTPRDNVTSPGLIHVASNAFSGAGGTPNADGTDADNTATLFIDTVRPTVAVSTDRTNLRLGETALVTFALSEPSADFGAADVAVTGGVLSNFSGSGSVYTATFSPNAASGTISVASATFSDAAGNFNADGADANNLVAIAHDGTRPTVVVSTDRASLKQGEAAVITFTLSEPSTDFGTPDVTVTGGTLSNFVGSGTVYTATFTPSAAAGSVSVASAAFSDAAGNFNADGLDADNSVAISYDGTSPTVVVSTDRASLKLGETATITFTLSEPSADFSAADVAVTGGTLSNFSGSGSVYTATFTPSGAAGSVTVASGVFADAAGNFNGDGSDADNSVAIAYDGARPTIAISADRTNLRRGDTAVLTFTLSEPSSDFVLGDIAVAGGTLSDFTGSGTTYTARFTPTIGVAMTGSISVASAAFTDAAGNLNNDGSDADNRVALAIDTLSMPSVSNPVVNEASPFAVFTVSASPGQSVTLALSAGTATGLGTDFGSEGPGGLEVSIDGGVTWSAYASNVTVPALGTFLVRTPVVDDGFSDDGETFALTVTTGTGTTTGTATLKDDGGGDVYRPDGSIDPSAPRSDDRPVFVSNPIVNEASPTAVFTVSGSPGRSLSLALEGGSATGGGTDFGPGLQVSVDGGTTWADYAGPIALPASGQLLVRTSIVDDAVADNGEAFALIATPRGGAAVRGDATIRDDGTGSIFGPDGSIDASAVPDDDRPLSVSSPTVSEASPYIVFAVDAAGGERVTLALESGTATAGADTGTALEVFDGIAWRSYNAGSLVQVGGSGRLLVRVAVVNDSSFEGSETLRLLARSTGGTAAVGTATIRDDGGSAEVFTADNSDGVAATGTADDDRPVAVDPPPVLPPAAQPAAPEPAPVAAPAFAFDVPVAQPTVPITFASVERVATEAVAALPDRFGDALTQPSGFRVMVLSDTQPRLSVFMGITDQYVEPGDPSSFTLPSDAFAHTQPDATVSLTARRADGAELPAWVQFDARTGTFRVDPPAGFDGELQVVVIARDAEGREARSVFKMSIGKGKRISFGHPGLSEQIRVASQAGSGWMPERVVRVPA
ncbi:hypothetical protein GCM10007320_54090 [Pseudorhodoferax aquiterrae]|uniref:Tandem-95 repeat protein n=1 Tax=Pseudorhodoferax aquiterrae TaxID=747304 RepID=A0ABQ3GAE7_9BURK|nr:Ig-like domain-containing protein [Pseudorhodoferax aquiterrae]GHC98419.1 hypothetical protein GCM10007320_54090 [Pseudorhodoferax aquiterrae]